MEQITFGEWLDDTLQDQRIKPADLSRMSGLDSGVISNLMNNKRKAGVDTCKAISKALKIPLPRVLQAAGIIPPDPEKDDIIEAASLLMLELPVDVRLEIYEYVKLKHKLTNSKNRHKTIVTRSAKRHAGT